VAEVTREELEAENARLAGRVAELEATTAEQTERLAEQTERLAEQTERLKQLERLVESLQRRGKRQAAPFSKGDPVTDPKKPGRKSGEAHGRHGHRFAPAHIDRELDAPLPGCCPDCGGGIIFERFDEQFQTEVPEMQPRVTRFVVGIGRCARCARRVQGRHLEQTSDALGAAGSQLGPNARGFGHWLHYVLGLSFAKAASVLARLGVPVTAGALSSGAQSTGRALAPTTKEIVAKVASSDVVVMDETGWRISGWGAWLWVATTPAYTAYNVAWERGFADATDLVPADYTGTIVRDGYVAYRNYQHATHQTCTAHLLRRCGEMIEADPDNTAVPLQVKRLLKAGLAARALPDQEREVEAIRIGDAFDVLAERPTYCDADRRLIKHLTNERNALLTFLGDPAVDATNWRGEQAIRPAVVNRKVFGGNRTDTGALTQSRMMTYFRTAVQQAIDPIAGLVELARAPDRHIIGGLGLT
jgi:transposase